MCVREWGWGVCLFVNLLYREEGTARIKRQTVDTKSPMAFCHTNTLYVYRQKKEVVQRRGPAGCEWDGHLFPI